MPSFAANLSLLFTEHAFLERFARAAACGFDAVECQFPYAHDPLAIAERLDATGLTQVLVNLPAGDWEAGERGIAILPDRVGAFREGIARAIDYAQRLQCRRVNCLAGLTPPDGDQDRLHETLVDNLAFAARRLEEAGIRLLIVPINTHDVPRFFLTGTQQALAVIEAVGSDNLFIQFDVYHATRMGEDVPAILDAHLDRIGHIQIADCPGRYEPGTGAIDFPALFRQLDALGYQGAIGCEYMPSARTEDGLGWLARERAAQRGMKTQ